MLPLAARRWRTLRSEGSAAWPSIVIANSGSTSDIGTAVSLVATGQAHSVLYAGVDRLGDATSAVIAQRQPSQVLLAGDTRTLRPIIEFWIGQLAPDATVERISGRDGASRQAAAARRASGTEPSTLAIVNASSMSAVGTAVSLVATGQAHSVLYAGVDRLGDAAAAVVAQRRPAHVLLVGGPLLLHPAIEDEIGEIAPASIVTRVAGGDATSTQADATRRLRASGISVFVIANGWMPGEIGIAASFASAHDDMAMLYSYKHTMGAAALSIVRRIQPDGIVLIGQPDSLSYRVHREARRLLPGARVQRIAGATLGVTAAQAAQQALVDLAPLQRRRNRGTSPVEESGGF